MIVGTAGHIDHGKTALVKALTGVDTDRLEEEKARGITIDLGFAYQPQDGGDTLAFVDVPGHERLIRNMLAGATGIDHVLLVVACDDGPMPQTREHLAILDLLGLTRGVVALSKCDLVDAARIAAVEAEVRALLAPTGLAGAPLLPVSAVSGQGIAELQRHLRAAAAEAPPRAFGGNFRLAVDRCFTLAGFGTVVTGTAAAGRVAAGDKLVVSPRGLAVRVRGLHVDNAAAEHGSAGRRCALNLTAAGLDKSDIARGDWLVHEAVHAPTTRIDARLTLLAAEARPLGHWTPVRLHLGAVEVGARVIPLDVPQVGPGGQALVQLELDRPIGALRGDRYILRDQSARRTLGGGAVIDPFAQPRGRRRPQRLAMLRALEAPTPQASLERALALAPDEGIDLQRFATLWNLDAPARDALLAAVPHRLLDAGALRLAFGHEQLERVVAAAAEALRQHHERQPDSPGLLADALKRTLAPQLRGEVWALLLRHALASGRLLQRGPYIALAGHAATLLPAELALWQRIEPWMRAAGLQPHRLGDLVALDRQRHRPEQIGRLLEKLARMGQLYAVGHDYFLLPAVMAGLAEQVQSLAAADPHRRINVKALREATGMSRHLSLPLVEFFDHIGFTKRDAEGRKIRRDAAALFGSHEAR